MKMGFRVALVSDAGTPTISDPGFKLTSAAHDEGIAVEALPGPCALTTAISAAGFPSEKFSFMGYLPKTESEKIDLIVRAEQLGQTVAFYDSPNRLVRSLQNISEIYGENHQVFVALELTKLHESHYRGSLEKVIG
jgi:16S rRNA (cytidine1402-2'-O)-methyltransferase